MTTIDPEHALPDLIRSFSKARSERDRLQPIWQACRDYAQPHHILADSQPIDIFDSTLANATEQLAALLSAELTISSAHWTQLTPARSVPDPERPALAQTGRRLFDILSEHLQRSNFTTELHQSILDLVTIGTATLSVQEGIIGESSAFFFKTLSSNDVIVDESSSGRLERTWINTRTTLAHARERFRHCPDLVLHGNPDDPIDFIELVVPDHRNGGFRRLIAQQGNPPILLSSHHLSAAPVISFRWRPQTGGVYGRSPVMTALPDAKTANHLVELILKNASLAISGIWQADDDGILDVGAIDLVPGAIIPKAVGSQGLTALPSSGRFDVSQLILEDLRRAIRSGMLVDRLDRLTAPTVTATEVLDRRAEANRLFGSVISRLQSELMLPLVRRCGGILHRRGLVDATALLDGRLELAAPTPLSALDNNRAAQGLQSWLNQLPSILAANEVLDVPATAIWLARTLGAPTSLIRSVTSTPEPLSSNPLPSPSSAP